MAVDVIYLANDNLLELQGLTNAASGAYVNDATVTATVVDKNGANVAGGSWPLTLAYVAASNGKYRGTLQETLTLTEGQDYTAKVTVAGAGLTAFFEHPLRALKRI
ncbi:MAG: hypothetical protein ACREYC_14670 [Gammaproteobacteria bacterium]